MQFAVGDLSDLRKVAVEMVDLHLVQTREFVLHPIFKSNQINLSLSINLQNIDLGKQLGTTLIQHSSHRLPMVRVRNFPPRQKKQCKIDLQVRITHNLYFCPGPEQIVHTSLVALTVEHIQGVLFCLKIDDLWLDFKLLQNLLLQATHFLPQNSLHL